MARFSTRIIILFLFALPAAYMGIHAQGIALVSVDSSAFPKVRARFHALGADGSPISGLSRESFTITEGDARREVLSFSCPPPGELRAISSVLTIDVSGSMKSAGYARKGEPNIQLARAAALAWINGLPQGESQCAITTFDDQGLVVQDFTRDRARLRAAAAALAPQGGTNYNAGLIDPQAGGLTIATTGTGKRVVVFLTDGQGSGNENAIVAAAQGINATIYCVTLNMPAPEVLKKIAARTGGACFENVTTVEEAENVYRAILYGAQGGQPCEISWRSEPGCASARSAVIALPSHGRSVAVQYSTPPQAVALLELSPAVLSFGKTAPGERKEMRITLTARNAPITITSIDRVGRPNAAFALDAATVPFTLAPGESRTFTARYTPADSSYAFARWNISSNACSGNSILVSGGSSRATATTINLLRPNGGERFRAGEETTIAWEGVLPTDTVRLDYSIDNGASWRTVVSRATGLQHRWKVPATPSENCLARVTQVVGRDSVGMNHRSFSGHGDWVLGFNFSPDGSRMVTASWDGTIRTWDVASGRQLQSFSSLAGRPETYQKRVYYAEFSPDGSAVLTGGDGDNVQVWDAASGRLRHRFKGRLYAKPDALSAMIDGSSSPDPIFSADGSRVLLLSEKMPVIWDAVGGRKLHELQGHSGWVNMAIFSPDGRRVLTAGKDQTARLWDAATGAEVRRFTDHDKDVLSVTFSPDAATLATVSADGIVRIWNADTGERLHAIDAGRRTGSSIPRALFSPDGTSIIIWAGIDAVPKLYDYRTGAVIHELAQLSNGKPFTTMPVTFVTFNADGSLIAIVTGDKVELWDATLGELIGEAAWDSQMSYAVFSPNSEQIATAIKQSMVVWDVMAPPLQADRSDNQWAIIADARPVAIDVDFGKRITRSSTDSVVVDFIRNEGIAPLVVDAITIDGANAKEFALVSGIPPFQVPPGGSRPVEFRFTPTATGPRTATVRVDAGGMKIARTLRGDGVQPQLRVESAMVDFGDVPVGRSRDSVVQVMLRNSGSGTINVSSVALMGPDTAQFKVLEGGSFTLPPRGAYAMTLRFSPERGGRTSSRLAFAHDGAGSPVVAQLFGRGVGDEDEGPGMVYTDPTTFRSIALPNAIVPPKGRVMAGVYDLLGVTAGYVPLENVMILGGGAMPFPDDWGGVKGTMYAAYSIGVKWGFSPMDRLNIALGYQWGQSIYDEDLTPEQTDSRIRVNAPYGAISYGDDDSRISATFGYAFKRHVTIKTTFDNDALLLGIGGDYRFANRWKVAAEVLAMQTLDYIPVALTARFFGERYAIDAGIGYLGITTPGGKAPTPSLVPVVSYVVIF